MQVCSDDAHSQKHSLFSLFRCLYWHLYVTSFSFGSYLSVITYFITWQLDSWATLKSLSSLCASPRRRMLNIVPSVHLTIDSILQPIRNARYNQTTLFFPSHQSCQDIPPSCLVFGSVKNCLDLKACMLCYWVVLKIGCCLPMNSKDSLLAKVELCLLKHLVCPVTKHWFILIL